MLKKSAWMLVLLVALLAVSVTAAWAAGATRSTQASSSLPGAVIVMPSKSTGGALKSGAYSKQDGKGRCARDSAAVSADPAY